MIVTVFASQLIALCNRNNQKQNQIWICYQICFYYIGMAPYSVMVTGANRGIGLGLVKQLLKNNDIQIVIATALDPNDAKMSGVFSPTLVMNR